MTDLEGPTSEMWSDLQARPPASAMEFSILDILMRGEPTGILMALSADGRLHLMVPLEEEDPPEGPLSITLKGLEVEEFRLRQSGRQGLYLNASSDPAHEPIFTALSRELANVIAVGNRNPRSATKSMIRRWKRYWSNFSKGLTEEKLIGLLAEVWLLNNYLIPAVGPEAVEKWDGPSGQRHDFQGVGLHVEVKATRSPTLNFHINGHDQLFPLEGKELVLFTMQLSRETGGLLNLDAEIEACKESLAATPSLLDEFTERLYSVGYLQGADPDVIESNFRIRAADFFLVDENFPRFPLDDLPSGIIRVDYQLDLSNVASLAPDSFTAICNRLR